MKIIFIIYVALIFFTNTNTFNGDIDGYDTIAVLMSLVPSFILLISMVIYPSIKKHTWINDLVLISLALPYMACSVVNWLRRKTNASRIIGNESISGKTILITAGQIFPTISLIMLAGTYMNKGSSLNTYIILERSIAIGASLSYLIARICGIGVFFLKKKLMELIPAILIGLIIIEQTLINFDVYILAGVLFVSTIYLALASIYYNNNGKENIVFIANVTTLLVIFSYIFVGTSNRLSENGLTIYILSQMIIFTVANVITSDSKSES